MQTITHRIVKQPTISARFLADYMAAGQRERARRTIIQGCKYRSTARLVQHSEARAIVSGFIRSENQDVNALTQKADWLRNKLSDSDFEADQNQHNADYVARFAKVFPNLTLPAATMEVPGKAPTLTLNGVRVTTDIHFRLRRMTKTNKVRIGAAMHRYAKGKALSLEAGEWQSAYLFGYLQTVAHEAQADAERKLCITIDAYSATVYAAPSDSVNRFHEIEATCATIAERWPNIEPPSNAVFPGDE
jgi:hypothetical protein